MTKSKTKVSEQEKIVGLLQDLLIVNLATAGVPQLEIRKILGVDIIRVSRIVKFFRK